MSTTSTNAKVSYGSGLYPDEAAPISLANNVVTTSQLAPFMHYGADCTSATTSSLGGKCPLRRSAKTALPLPGTLQSSVYCFTADDGLAGKNRTESGRQPLL
jgi:hypothetical protein